MNEKHLLALDEIADYIKIQNPQGRKYVVSKEKSGWKDEQVFTSDIFPDLIEDVHVKELTKKIGHPVFCLEPSNKKLVLQGWHGYSYGPDIIDKICDSLISTKYCCTARNIRMSEFGAIEKATDAINEKIDDASKAAQEGLEKASEGIDKVKEDVSDSLQ